MRRLISCVLMLALGGFVVAACAAPTPTPTPAVTPSPDPIAQGGEVYRASGCAGCHGGMGEGTGRAPSVAGGVAEQIKEYVRQPSGSMPAFGPDRLSDPDLDTIAQWLSSLGGSN